MRFGLVSSEVRVILEVEVGMARSIVVLVLVKYEIFAKSPRARRNCIISRFTPKRKGLVLIFTHCERSLSSSSQLLPSQPLCTFALLLALFQSHSDHIVRLEPCYRLHLCSCNAHARLWDANCWFGFYTSSFSCLSIC